MIKRSFIQRMVPLSLAVVAVTLAMRRRPDRRLRSGQVAIITGGSSGLGLALAHEFGRAGLKLVLAARNGAGLEAAKQELLSNSAVQSQDDITLVACDLSDKHQAQQLIRKTMETFGTVDLLVNDAGIIEVGPIENQSIENFENAMAINFFGALHTIFAVLPVFLRKKRGAIVNISSVGGKIPVPHLLPYVASKFALTGFSEGLHSELREKGVRVTTVCPGLMRTGGENHAYFSGNVKEEKAWFQTSARTPLISANLNHAAREIVSAVNAGRPEITITPQAWLAARFVGLAPETSQVIASFVNRFVLPKALITQED